MFLFKFFFFYIFFLFFYCYSLGNRITNILVILEGSKYNKHLEIFILIQQ